MIKDCFWNSIEMALTVTLVWLPFFVDSLDRQLQSTSLVDLAGANDGWRIFFIFFFNFSTRFSRDELGRFLRDF
jgi:hypothetical protein